MTLSRELSTFAAIENNVRSMQGCLVKTLDGDIITAVRVIPGTITAGYASNAWSVSSSTLTDSETDNDTATALVGGPRTDYQTDRIPTLIFTQRINK